ncbi:hypothetical protein E0500_023305 [Streptomyces sp. KM273126]|uniref:hypothetical protein n=1 Tax=Streptomyces sp. KM273126 TaxID=2545247 RepID=UPI00103E063E|nr:hypothetical protein [Streptomyces sp. KM273126]MBA2810240.1 hypothetical protein [Streptomyces sp. KM273126]
MRHTLSTTAPRPVAARGLGAVVLIALLALLHATFSPGPSHLSALDLDGCRPRAVAASTLDCEASNVLASAGGTEGHPDGDAAQPCEASAYGPRPLAEFARPPAAFGATSDVPSAASPGNVSPAARGASDPDAPSGSLVLRC